MKLYANNKPIPKLKTQLDVPQIACIFNYFRFFHISLYVIEMAKKSESSSGEIVSFFLVPANH